MIFVALLNHILDAVGLYFVCRAVYHLTRGNGVSRAIF